MKVTKTGCTDVVVGRMELQLLGVSLKGLSYCFLFESIVLLSCSSLLCECHILHRVTPQALLLWYWTQHTCLYKKSNRHQPIKPTTPRKYPLPRDQMSPPSNSAYSLDRLKSYYNALHPTLMMIVRIYRACQDAKRLAKEVKKVVKYYFAWFNVERLPVPDMGGRSIDSLPWKQTWREGGHGHKPSKGEQGMEKSWTRE